MKTCREDGSLSRRVHVSYYSIPFAADFVFRLHISLREQCSEARVHLRKIRSIGQRARVTFLAGVRDFQVALLLRDEEPDDGRANGFHRGEQNSDHSEEHHDRQHGSAGKTPGFLGNLLVPLLFHLLLN